MRSGVPEAIERLRRNLNGSLFKAAPEPAARLSRWELAILLASLLALATILQLLRIGPGIALDSLWAEDGPVFLQGAIQHGFWTDLWSTYNGYLVFVPRLVGDFGHLFALRDAAAAMALLSTFLVAISGLAIWLATAAHLRNPYLRGTLVTLTVLPPTASLESIASGTYVSWFMLFAVFWLLIWRPRSAGAAALGGAFILITSLSTPGVWFFAPLAFLRAIAIRDRRDGILVGSWAAGSAIQVVAYSLQNEKMVEPLWSNDVWTAYLQRVLDAGALGERLGGRAWEAFGWPLLIALLALAVVGLFLGLRRADAGARWLALLAIPISVAMFVVVVYQRAVGPQMRWPADVYFGAAGRYTIVPALLLVSLVLVLVEGAARRRPSHGRWLAGAAAAVLIAGMAISFDVRDSAYRGTPSWSDALDSAAAQCRTEGATVVTVPISPQPFALAVSCDEVTSS